MKPATKHFLVLLTTLGLVAGLAGCTGKNDNNPRPQPSPQIVTVGSFRLLLDGSRHWDPKVNWTDEQGVAHALDLPYGPNFVASLGDLVVGDDPAQNYLEGLYPLANANSVGQEFIDAAIQSGARVKRITAFPAIGHQAPSLPVARLTAPGDFVTVFSVVSKEEPVPVVLAIVVRDPNGGRVSPDQVLTITVNAEKGATNVLSGELTFTRLLLQATKAGAPRR